jgi:hypothetical protein
MDPLEAAARYNKAAEAARHRGEPDRFFFCEAALCLAEAGQIDIARIDLARMVSGDLAPENDNGTRFAAATGHLLRDAAEQRDRASYRTLLETAKHHNALMRDRPGWIGLAQPNENRAYAAALMHPVKALLRRFLTGRRKRR